MLDTLSLERRVNVSTLASVCAYAGSLLLALVFSLSVLVAAGVPTGALYQELVVQVFFAEAGLTQTITIATPMLLVGLAAALTLRLGFWNIGIEGQMLLGAIGATAVALYDVGGPMRLPLMLIAATLGGAFWIAAPLLLRLKLGVSEVVVSLLLSNVAYLLLQHLLFGAFGDPTRQFPTSPVFEPAERLSQFGYGDIHTGLIVALAAVVAASILIDRSRFGFFLRFVGDNPKAAEAAGFPVGAVMIISILAGGAMAGLAGGVVVAGTEHRLTQYVALHATFSGIVIAALARYRPLALIPAALFLAGLNVASSSLKVFYSISEGVVLIIQGIVLMTLVAGQFLTTYRVARQPRSAPS